MTGRFGANPYAKPAAAPAATPAAPASGGRFGANPFTNLLTPQGTTQTVTEGALLQAAQAKLKNGGVLTPAEAAAVARQKADQRALSAIATALQPLLAPSDVIKGVAQDVKDDITSGQPFTHTQGGNRGMATATAHLTYGLTERLPGFAGARAAGVTGEQLLKGTKYEGNGKAALLVELLSDPSLVLGGGGLVLKGAGMAGKYASLAEFASTASGANALRDMANVVNNAGSKLLHLSDEATGVPAAARIVGGSKAGQAVKAGVSKLADTTMPAPLQRAMGVRTYGDAFLTPDQKAAAYTAEQLKRDAFRDSTRLGVDDLGSAITRSAVEDAKIVGNLTKGLKPADAAAVNRLYGKLANTTDPAVAAQVFKDLAQYRTPAGASLEVPMVEAYKATDRISQQTLGHNLVARNLPAVLDPATTKAIQQAQTGADLLPHIGGYKTLEGRPRGVLVTQYKGRGDLDKTINKIEDADPVAASVNLNDPALAPAATQKIAGTLDRAAAELPELPPAPVAPVGVRPAAAAPTNPAETLDRILAEPGGVKPAASVSDAAAAPVPPAPVPRSPAEVMDELFGGRPQTAPPLKPFEPERFTNAETTYRGERQPGQYAGLDAQLVNAEDAAGLRIAQEHSDLLYVTPDRGMAEGFAEPMRPMDTPAVRELKIAPTKTLDLGDVAPSGTVSSMQQVEDVLTKLGVPAQQWPKVKDLWGATPAWENTLTQRGLREAGSLNVYDLFRDEATGIVKAAVRDQGADAIRFGPEGSREVIVLDRSRAAEVTPEGLRPTSPDVVPYNKAASFLDTGKAAEPSTADLFTAPRNAAPVTSDLPIGGKVTPAPRESGPLLDDQLRDWYGEEAGKVASRVTPADEVAIKDYVGANFRPINMLLRDSAAFDEYGYTAANRLAAQQTIASLDEALGRYTIQRPLTVYRGIGGDYGIDLSRAAKAGNLTGTDLADLSYASTTVSRKVADQFGQHFVVQIDVPAGTRGMPLHRLGDAGEQELLLARGTRYRVTGVEQQGDRMVARAELLPPDPNTAVPFGRPALGDKTRYIPASAAEQPPRFNLGAGRNLSPKTPAETLDALLNAPRPQTGYATAPDLARTPQADLKAAANITTPAERLVSKAVPTTYRTVSIDPSALDWASLPDQAARRAVANVLGGEIVRTAEGGFKYSRDLAEVPLSHPVISHYFDDATLEAARFTGTGYGERVIAGRQQVPDWYDPKSGQPLDLQRAERDATLNGTPLNDLGQMERTANELNTGNLDSWIVGDSYVESLRAGRPLAPTDFPRAGNDYSQRVIALNGRPATPGELFAYKMRLARYNQEARLRTVTGEDITNHLTDYFAQHPEGTLFDAVTSASRQFGLGRGGRDHLQTILRDEESGFVRQMSSTEQANFAQYLKADQRSSIPGGSVVSRMLRNPEAVSAQFKQVFEQDFNGLRLLDEQIQRNTGAILQAEQLARYSEYLKQTGQHYTARQLIALNARPAHLLTAEEARILRETTYATESAGRKASWTIMDRDYGVFKVGDAVPWWAYYDIFHASSVADAAVSGTILGKGGLHVWDRSFAALNATRLSSPSSIFTDQVGQLLQMVMYGVTPDEIINGMIQRAIAKPAALDAMRESGGIASAKLESNLSVDGAELRALARRLEGDTDMTRMQRVVDSVLRYNDYGTGIDRAALSNPAVKIASDITHFGSAKLFQFRSAMSDLQRESLYFHYLSTGKTPAQAGAAANEVLLDFRLAPAYARTISKWWPFFRWISMSGPRSIVNILRKPSISHAWNRSASLSDEATDDGRNDARRTLTRPSGLLWGTAGNEWMNLGAEERDGVRVYLNATNWSPNNTIPQLLDFSGTKLGVVALPDFVTIPQTLITGNDRNGVSIYRESLDGKPGGWTAAEANDPMVAAREAAMYLVQQFQPSYAPGSTRARNWADSVVETSKLPADGSKDITIAQTLMALPGGRSFLNYMQHGPAAWGMVALSGNRGSAYSSPPGSMARSSLSLLLPLQGVQGSQHVQGAAAAALNVGLLDLQSWRQGEVRRIQNMMAGGADPVMVRAAQQQAMREYQRRAQQLNVTNLVTK